MAAKVVMEALSPTMEEGRVVKWHKRAGEAVRAGETLAEIETDKAIMDLVARADGVLTEVSAAEGATVPVGREIAVIADAGAETPAGSGPPPGAAPAPSAPASAPPAPRVVPDEPPHPVVAEGPSDGPRRVRASPLARRIAREAGVNLQVIAGSGPGGRVVKRDLDGLRDQPAPAAAAAPTLRPGPSRPAAPPSPALGPDGGYEDVPLTQMRKAIAQRLAASLGPIPHFFLTTEVDMGGASEARAAVNARRGPEDRISVNDIVLKATALALTRHRSCNAWFGGDHIRYWRDVHLGMAVAVDDGLITPVIRHADRKSLADIGREARRLAENARARRLQPPDYTGATFSVSNLGMFDIDQFGAVINPPEAGILAVGTIVSKPVAVEGQVTIRPRLRMTLSCDHRVIDGATGAALLKTLKEMLENPLAMLL